MSTIQQKKCNWTKKHWKKPYSRSEWCFAQLWLCAAISYLVMTGMIKKKPKRAEGKYCKCCLCSTSHIFKHLETNLVTGCNEIMSSDDIIPQDTIWTREGILYKWWETEHTIVILWKGRQIAQKRNTRASGYNVVLSRHPNTALNLLQI